MTGPVKGRLLDLVAADLDGYRRVTTGYGRAVFEPEDGGPVLEIGVRVEKRFLGRTEIAQFRAVTPAPVLGRGRLSVTHTGRVHRQGIAVRVVEGSDETEQFAEALVVDPGFAAAAVGLDFTCFHLELDGESCVATVELMGASLVSIAFPPIRSYVRLHDDQREALLNSLATLARVAAR